MGEQAGRVFSVRCICGNVGPIHVRSFGRPFTCGGCRARIVPVWGIDPKTRKAATITFEAAGTGFKLPAGMFELGCPCGLRLYARPRQAGRRVQCPVCDNWMKLEHSKDPQTLETRIRVVESRLNQLPAMPPPPPRPAVPDQFILCSCGESIRVEASSGGTEVRCTACSTRIRLEMNQDSVSSVVVVDPGAADSAPAVGKPGFDEALSLDDFR